MKKSEIITAARSAIAETMVEKYSSVIDCDGRIQYKIYIWEDGEIECLQDVQGGNTRLQPCDAEPRELYYVTTVSEAPGFYLFDCTDEIEPEDEDEREAKAEEIREWLVDCYKENLSATIDAIIEDAEQEEA